MFAILFFEIFQSLLICIDIGNNAEMFSESKHACTVMLGHGEVLITNHIYFMITLIVTQTFVD